MKNKLALFLLLFTERKDAKELRTPLSCFALVTPDGVWHERGEMGWFGMVANEKEQDDWEREVADILQNHQEDILVGVDCHI